MFDVHSEAFVDLCDNPGPVPFDHRAATIELHYDENIKLTKDNVLAIVAPDTACEGADLINFANTLSADLVQYRFDFEAAAIRQRQVRDATLEWLKLKTFVV